MQYSVAPAGTMVASGCNTALLASASKCRKLQPTSPVHRESCKVLPCCAAASALALRRVGRVIALLRIRVGNLLAAWTYRMRSSDIDRPEFYMYGWKYLIPRHFQAMLLIIGCSLNRHMCTSNLCRGIICSTDRKHKMSGMIVIHILECNICTPASNKSTIAILAPVRRTSIPRCSSPTSRWTTLTFSDTPLTATTCSSGSAYWKCFLASVWRVKSDPGVVGLITTTHQLESITCGASLA